MESSRCRRSKMRNIFLFALVLAFSLALTPLTGLAAGPADLIDAVQSGNTTAAIKLIEAKVDVNGTSADGTTALHWAVHNADAGMVDRLIKAGANVNVKNEYGLAPIVEAANVGNTAILESLLKA